MTICMQQTESILTVFFKEAATMATRTWETIQPIAITTCCELYNKMSCILFVHIIIYCIITYLTRYVELY